MFAFASVAIEWVKTNLKNEEGQAMAEYGIILAVVAVVCVVAFTALATGIGGTITNVVSNL
jgi:pilus assembly protein Flp/PilA